jgi:pimeloyl-ACP methyl ester carboxylesterase
MPRFDRNGFVTHFEVCGSGAPLLLIAGLGASTLQWQTLSPYFAKHLQVIVFDNRGAGRSSAPDELYSIGQMADDASYEAAVQGKVNNPYVQPRHGFVRQAKALLAVLTRG